MNKIFCFFLQPICAFIVCSIYSCHYMPEKEYTAKFSLNSIISIKLDSIYKESNLINMEAWGPDLVKKYNSNCDTLIFSFYANKVNQASFNFDSLNIKRKILNRLNVLTGSDDMKIVYLKNNTWFGYYANTAKPNTTFRILSLFNVNEIESKIISINVLSKSHINCVADKDFMDLINKITIKH